MHMFEPKNVLLVKNYAFENDTQKDKILIVLDNLEDELCILQVLTTSQDKYVPNDKMRHGCTNEPNSRLSFHLFEKDIVVGKNMRNQDFAFTKNTFVIFQNNISKKSTLDFLSYQNDIHQLATLSEESYKSLVLCIANSFFLKRNLKPYIQKIITNNNY